MSYVATKASFMGSYPEPEIEFEASTPSSRIPPPGELALPLQRTREDAIEEALDTKTIKEPYKNDRPQHVQGSSRKQLLET